jgi:hypothetical protein
MDELRQHSPKLSEKEIHVSVEIHDWFLKMSASTKSIAAVYPWMPQVTLLGDKSRSFKPGFHHTVHVRFNVTKCNATIML